MPESIKHIFATNLKRYRLSMGLSQEAFADLCRLHRTYISSVERCQRNISIENIQRIATALGVPAYYLLISENDQGEINRGNQ